MEITAASPITGFEPFGTNDGSQLAGSTRVGISTYGIVFVKVEDDGWTGVAFVNIEHSTATVKLTAYADSGAVVATEVINVGANASGYSRQLFFPRISALPPALAFHRTVRL